MMYNWRAAILWAFISFVFYSVVLQAATWVLGGSSEEEIAEMMGILVAIGYGNLMALLDDVDWSSWRLYWPTSLTGAAILSPLTYKLDVLSHGPANAALGATAGLLIGHVWARAIEALRAHRRRPQLPPGHPENLG